ncbi:MAG: hypothetical protein NTV48_03305, partial [Candidatus Vogelbacteria bacterium]|nr:hypothetical protein [Candidatus Vogelbacteria bacterium]
RNQNGQNVLQGLTGSASADLANQRIQQEADVDLSRCRSMIDGWIDAGLRYQACLDAQNQIWAQQTSKKQADEALIKKLEAENEDMTNFTKRYLACIKLSGPNSHPTGTDSCQCDTGYEIKIIGEKPTCEKIVEVPKVEYKPIVASSTPKKIQKKSRPEVVSIPTPKPKEVLIPKENKDSLSTWLTNLEASSTVTIEEKKKNPGFFQRILSFFGIFK